MKTLLLFCFLFCCGVSASAQNFYVIRVDGNVYTKKKKLKKRDKISIDDRLIFGDRKAKIRLLNAEGNYVLYGSQAMENTQNELIIELRNEVFAQVRIDSPNIGFDLRILSAPHINALPEGKTYEISEAGTTYFRKKQTDETREILKPEDGKITLRQADFLPEPDTAFFIKSYPVKDSTILDTMFSFSSLTWLTTDSVTTGARRLLQEDKYTNASVLSSDLHDVFRSRGLLFLQNHLTEIIADNLHWYEYAPVSPFTLCVPDLQFTYRDLMPVYDDLKPLRGEIYLARLGVDTLTAAPVSVKDGIYRLRRRDFGPLLPLPDFTSNYALILLSDPAQPIEEATVLHEFRLRDFTPKNYWEKQVKYLQRKGKLLPASALRLTQNLINEEYGDDNRLFWEGCVRAAVYEADAEDITPHTID